MMRAAVKHRGASTNEETASFIDHDDSKKGVGMMGQFLKTRIGGFLCFLGLFVVVTTHSGQSSNSASKPSTTTSTKSKTGDPPSPMADYPDLSLIFSKYDNCQVQWEPPPPKDNPDSFLKPFWMPAYPGSGTTGPAGHGDILKPLINGITGLAMGAKFYHASGKDLKRCRGRTETAVCAQGHPIVEVGPERQTDNFQKQILLVIRSFRTAFPVYHNDKAHAYHDATEQTPVNEWRRARDEWYDKTFLKWKEVVTTWKNMRQYEIGEIVQYEELMDPNRGPEAMERMANLFKSVGFAVAPKEDLSCIWYKVVKEEYLRLHEYSKYHYGYTKEQQQHLLKEMKKFQKEVEDDPRLVKILREYYEDIRDNTYIDIPHQEDRR